MEQIKLGGSTQDLAEAIVDYKTKRIELKGIPEDTTFNRVKAALQDWLCYILLTFGISAFLWNHFKLNFNHFLIGSIIITGILLSLHTNKKFDRKVKKWFAIRTAKGKRNRLIAENFTTKEFVIYDTKNVVVEFEATGDVNKQLERIWIRDEDKSAILTQQAKIISILFKEKEPQTIWNVHFIFENVPKDGTLKVEWI